METEKRASHWKKQMNFPAIQKHSERKEKQQKKRKRKALTTLKMRRKRCHVKIWEAVAVSALRNRFALAAGVERGMKQVAQKKQQQNLKLKNKKWMMMKKKRERTILQD